MEYAFSSMGPTLQWVALVFIFIGLFAALGIAYVLASLPGKIASGRNHPQADAINICGWVGLPSGVFWVAALVWAFTRSGSDALADNATGLDPSMESLAEQVSNLESMVTILEQQAKRGQS